MVCLQKCCCCVSLKDGGIVLGYLGAVAAVLNCFSSIVLLFGGYDETIKNNTAIEPYILPFGIYGVIMAIITFVVCICLIYGTKNTNHRFLLPWLVMHMLSLVLFVILVVVIGTVLALTHNAGVGAVIVFIIGFAYAVFYLYIWLCVFSLFQWVRDGASTNKRTQSYGMVGSV